MLQKYSLYVYSKIIHIILIIFKLFMTHIGISQENTNGDQLFVDKY